MIGLIVAVPIGPVNLICIRRTLAFGPLNGFVSGLGAAVGDTVFAIVTGFGLTAVAQLIEGYSPYLELVGGAMLIYFGIHTYLAKVETRLEDKIAAKEKGASTLFRAMASTLRAHDHQSRDAARLRGAVCRSGRPCRRAARRFASGGFRRYRRGRGLDALVAGADGGRRPVSRQHQRSRDGGHQQRLRRRRSPASALRC